MNTDFPQFAQRRSHLPTPCGAFPVGVGFNIQVASIPQGTGNSNPNDYDEDHGDYVSLPSISNLIYDISTLTDIVDNRADFFLDKKCRLNTASGHIATFEKASENPKDAVPEVIKFRRREFFANYEEPQLSCFCGKVNGADMYGVLSGVYEVLHLLFGLTSW